MAPGDGETVQHGARIIVLAAYDAIGIIIDIIDNPEIAAQKTIRHIDATVRGADLGIIWEMEQHVRCQIFPINPPFVSI